jgi:hypothetical protein
MEGYKKHGKVDINGKSRVLYVKANTKSTNPVVYIQSDGKMILYKTFLNHKKIKGGA